MADIKLYTEDNYSSKLETPILTASGGIEFEVQRASGGTRWFIFIGPASNPEVMYFYNRIWNTYYVAAPGRLANRSTHEVNEPVKIINSAAVLNRIEDHLCTTFDYEYIDDLTIKLFGGPYTLDGKNYEAENQDITFDDNTTTYVYIRYSDNTIQTGAILAYINNNEHAEYGRLLLTVNTGGGIITSVGQTRSRDFISYNSLNLGGVNELTPALINSYINTLDEATMAAGSKIAFVRADGTVDKSIDVEDFVDFIQDQGYIEPGFAGYTHTQNIAASTWTINHNLNSEHIIAAFYDLSSPANLIEPDTIEFLVDSIVVTWAGNNVQGKAVLGTPVGTASQSSAQPMIELIAWESMGKAKQTRMGISGREAGMNTAYIPDVISTFDTITSSKSIYQTMKILKTDLTKIQLYLKKDAAPDTTDVTIDIYACTTATIGGHVYNVPTGSSLATATIASGSLSTVPAWVTGTLSVPLTSLTPGNFYALKAVGVGAQTVYIGYGNDSVIYDTNGFQYISSLVPFVGDFAFKAQAADLVAENIAKAYLASAFDEETGRVVGATKAAVVEGGTARIETHTAASFSGLTQGEEYFLSDIPWEIDLNEGTNTIWPWLAVFTHSLIIR